MANKVFKVTNEVEHKSKGAENVAKDFDRINKSIKDSRGLVNDLNTRIAVLESRKSFAKSESDLKKVNKELEKANKEMDKLNKLGASQQGIAGRLNKTFGQLGTTIIAAFTVKKAIEFGKEVFMLAAKAEGVKRAFDKLNEPNLLKNLREATRGTVSDIELMQRAVRADKFKIPLNQLATFFKFATNRANETGESVDYLVQSIVDGIGRKSSLVLDNLGISAAEIQKEFKRTGDFTKAAANIIQRELDKSGDVIETQAEKVARLNAEWENLKLTIGEATISIIDFFNAPSIDRQRDNMVDFLRVINSASKDLGLSQKEIGELFTEGDNGISVLTKKGKAFFDILKQAEPLTAFGVDLKNLITIGADGFPMLSQMALDLQKTLSDLNKDQEVQNERTIADIRREIDAQKELLEVAKARYKDTLPILIEINKLEEELNRLLTIREFQYKKLKVIETEFKKDSLKLTKEIKTAEDELIDEEYKNAIAIRDAKIMNEKTYVNAAIGLIDTLFAYRNRANQEELDLFRENAEERKKIIDEQAEYDIQADQKRFELGLISKTSFEANRVAISKNAAARQEAIDKEIERKQKELQRNQAIRDKLSAIFSIGINTSVAVSKLLATPPLAIAAGIAGAAELAFVAAQPIPQFAKGKKKGQKGGETSIVGEEGWEFMYVPNSATILNHKESKENEGILAAIQRNKLRSYVMNEYVPKMMIDTKQRKDVGQNILHSMILNSKAGDTQALIKAINRSSNISNAQEIGQEVAKAMSRSEYYSKYNW